MLALRAKIYGDMGGYVRTHGAVVPALAAGLLTGPYRVPSFQAAVHCLMTNKVGTGTYRGPGLYEGCFIRERLMDIVAGDLGLDPIEIRRRNLIQSSEMPFTVGPTRVDGIITVYDSGDYPSALNRMLQELDYDSLAGLQGQLRDGKYHGVGIACYVEPTGFGPYEGARIILRDAARVELYLGITSLGQGHETVMAQICADSLEMPIDNIRVFHGDTDYMPRSVGTFGSRGTVMAGNAILLASNSLKDRILDVAAGYLDTETSSLEFREGSVYRIGQPEEGPALGLADVIRLAESGEGAAGLDVTEYFRMGERTYAYGAHGAHVAVDPETGKLEILRYIVVEDVGRCVNPLYHARPVHRRRSPGHRRHHLGRTGLRRRRPVAHRHLYGLPPPHQPRHPQHRKHNPRRSPFPPQPSRRQGRRRRFHTGHRSRVGQRRLQRPENLPSQRNPTPPQPQPHPRPHQKRPNPLTPDRSP